MNTKKILCTVAVMAALLAISNLVHAQAGYNPEFLGNAAAAPRPGFSPKFFVSYYNQQDISASDVEVAFEPQYWIHGFTGKEGRDYVQFLAHLPIGYRTQKSTGSPRSSVTGLGSLNANIEHFWKIIDKENFGMWFDNGLSVGFPTATMNNGLRIGNNAYSIGWFQENCISFDKWLFSISPISLTWTFRDNKTNTRSGLSMNIMNSAVGYQVTKKISLGATFAYMLGNLAGTDDGTGNGINTSQRFYAGPAALIVINPDVAFQISGLIDAYTQHTDRGQGIFTTFWYMF